jgi:hypothetical protein
MREWKMGVECGRHNTQALIFCKKNVPSTTKNSAMILKAQKIDGNKGRIKRCDSQYSKNKKTVAVIDW